MKKTLLPIIISLLTLSTTAQTPGILSINKFGGSGNDEFTHITRLTNGNYVCSGHTTSSNGQATGNHGGTDFFLISFSERGQFLWSKVVGGSGEDGGSYAGNGEYLSPTPDGGFYFAGATASSNGDITTNHGSFDAFIARFDASGNITWKKTYGGSSTEWVSGIQTTSDGGCIFSATTYSGNNDGDVPSNHNPSYGDIWIVKLDGSGTIQWSKTYGGTSTETAMGIKNTPDGGYVFNADVASADGDLATTTARGKADTWIVKIDNTGAIKWSTRIGGSDDDDGSRIICSSTGDYYVLLNTRSADGNFISNTGLYDLGFIKLDANGNILWVKSLGGYAWDSGGDIVESNDGNILLTGISYSTQIAGIPFTNKGQADALLIKADRNTGNIQWMIPMGGTQGDFIRSQFQSPDGTTIVVGLTSSSDGDFSSAPGLGGTDAFITRIAPFNAVKGYVFWDNNGNGVKDAGETFAQNIPVVTTKTGSYSTLSFTDNNGNYRNEVDSGNFVTRPRIIKYDYYKITPDSTKSAFPGYYGSTTANFGLKALPGRRDLKVVILALNPARAGFNSYYRIICYNAGTDTVPAGTLNFIKDFRTTLVTATPAQTGVSGDTLKWQYTAFKPLDTLVFDLNLYLARPPFLHIGDWVRNFAIIEPITGDLVPSDNGYVLYHGVTGAYDPNDKKEAHGGLYSTKDLSQKNFLTYTIRFQNTGNDTAFNITVKDTLDPKLDPATLDLLTTSHRAQCKISNNIATWTFSNILLPDSHRNEAASHGFISFRIKPAASVKVGDMIRNNASIYFDYNDPVVTNTDTTYVKDATLVAPSLTASAITLCSNLPKQKIRFLNIPSPEYHAIASATLDNTPIVIDPDSTVTIDPAAIAQGNHTLIFTYTNDTDTAHTSRNFSITTPSTPQVQLSSNYDLVTDLQVTLRITATAQDAGTAPLFTVASDSLFTNILQAENKANTYEFSANTLAVGDNYFFVRVKTSDTCNTKPTNYTKIDIRRSPTTAVTDPANPGYTISVSPNPFTDAFQINGLAPGNTLRFELYDALGRSLQQLASAGRTSLTVRTNSAAGTLYLVIFNKQNQKLGTIPILKK